MILQGYEKCEEKVEKNILSCYENGKSAKKIESTDVLQSDYCSSMLPQKQNFPEFTESLKDSKEKSFSQPNRKVAKILTWIILIPFLWAILYSISGKESLPGGNLFSILILLLLAQLGGIFVSFIHLPPLLGMLIVGILVRSVPYLDIIGSNIDYRYSTVLRKTALVVILTKAGLGLDPKALRSLSVMVLKLGIFPSIVETVVAAIISHFLLDFPWLWSFMTGFIIAGVSPSVVVPCLLNLSDEGYGLNKGIPTLVIAGLSIDNVISISGFGVMLGIIFSEGSIAWQAFKGPIEVFVGVCYGTLVGMTLWYVPSLKEKGLAKYRFILLFLTGLLSVFGSFKIGFSGAGPIGCLSAAFVASIGWRKQESKGDKNSIKKNFDFLWKFFLPLLFGLIGTEIKITALDGNTVAYGLITLLISVSFRFVATFFAVLGGNLNLKERLFVALSWIPKATIQAAIGSAALDMARTFKENSMNETIEETLGKKVLTIAVLVILVAAPVGAIAIMASGQRLLHKTVTNNNTIQNDEDGEEMQPV